MKYVARYTYSLVHSKVDFGRYRRLQIYHVLLSNRDQGKKHLELPYWNRLSFFEKAWAFKLFLLLKLAKMNKFCSQIIMHYLKSRVEAHAFQAMVRTCNENDYNRLIEVFDAINTGALG